MRSVRSIPSKIFNTDELVHQIRRWRLLNQKIVMTNGVFDILHEGHIASLSEAAGYGDVLIVAVNSDASVKRLKGESRPVNHQNSRALILASLLITDAVILFEEDTPRELIKTVMPDVLVKGGDYRIEDIAGAKEVLANGGEVKLAEILEGISTTAIIEKMRSVK
jgi:D-glycero-beta-D-manno-heptose 1-phosphate adenylyltransferase